MKKRIISASVLFIVFGTCIFLSEYTRVLIWGVISIACAYEYSARLKEIDIHITSWILYAYLAVQVFLAITHCGRTTYIAWFTAAIYIALFSGIIHSKVRGKGAIYTVSALAYPCFPYALIMIISTSSRVWETLALACIPCWICDIFALFGGMLFGKHKFAPDVSPKKTIEGVISGALFSILAGYCVSFLFKDIPVYICLTTAFVASSAGQIGDLAESLIKRYINIKDFSNLIPGHGGMFDRTDSLMFAIPAAYLCLYLFNL